MANYTGNQIINSNQVQQLKRTIADNTLISSRLITAVTIGQEYPALSGAYLVS